MTQSPSRSGRRFVLWGALTGFALALTGFRVAAVLADAPVSPGAVDLRMVVLLHAVVPRVCVALAAGAALGLAGHILQRVLRNPLAEPSTLGIAAGAQLALAAATLHAPALIEWSREGVALTGAVAAVALLLALTWRRNLEPVAVALAGLMLSLTATMASAALILASGDYLFALFIWGGGSLVQQGWGPATALALRLGLGAVASLLLMRSLALFGLGDDGARGLGLPLATARLLAIAVAVGLAASVTAEVGVIGFIGLAAPTLARLAGAGGERARLIASPLIGALLLWLADGLVQALSGPAGERIPAGAATALLGGPLLLWLLPRLRLFEWPSVHAHTEAPVRSRHPGRVLCGLALLLIVTAAAALVIGAGIDDRSLAGPGLLLDLLPWRAPRIIVAAAAGALLAGAGIVLQRVTANPLAGPEILGVGSGAGVGWAVALFLFPASGPATPIAAAGFGAVAALAIVLGLARKGSLGPERLLLAGIAVGASAGAALTAIIATGHPQALALLRWLTGSIDGAGFGEAALAAGLAAVLLAPLGVFARPLALLALGETTARSAGLAAGRWRVAAVVLAGLQAAAASLFVGPLSFIGLIAPHVSRRIGLAGVMPQTLAAILIGGFLMTASDWLARVAAFPYQLPLGLFASLIGGAYLAWLLTRS